ncbi:PepSY domain-containing protein [Streptomyces sp. NPDC030392]|uniref:PepSY domain-containing protein n=1 Tax=Streptomyces sp. NPDC030392 TaxID=3155468 RepID=UPI00340FEB2E
MKRKLVIATLTAAALLGGGSYAAVAVAGEDATPSARTVADVVRDDRDGSDDADDVRDARAARAASVTAAEAIAAALKSTPGVVVSADLDDDASHWDVEVVGKDDRTHDLRVDAAKGTVTAGDTKDDADDDAKAGAAADDASADAAKTDDAKTDDSESDDAKTDDSKSDDAKADDAKADDAKADDSKSDDSETDDGADG